MPMLNRYYPCTCWHGWRFNWNPLKWFSAGFWRECQWCDGSGMWFVKIPERPKD